VQETGAEKGLGFAQEWRGDLSKMLKEGPPRGGIEMTEERERLMIEWCRTHKERHETYQTLCEKERAWLKSAEALDDYDKVHPEEVKN
jgi:hypothetical protein